MKTLQRCYWDEIKNGEICAWEGCFTIYEKISDTECLFIATDEKRLEKDVGHVCEVKKQHKHNNPFNKFGWRKLPKIVQKNWATV